jgi:LuxR family maltose regulon positive regulatory protein
MMLEAGEVREGGRSHVVMRPRLTRMLDAADARIILLVAPAGYGKTTLAREWLTVRPHTWYRGNVASADVAALALGITKAASKIAPGAGERLRARLRNSVEPTDEVDDLAELLAEDLADWPQSAYIAIDDYQFACDSQPAERFVEHLAASCPVRLLVASRTRPRWATTRRTLYGEIFEIGRSLLAMSKDEAACVLGASPIPQADGLFLLADGWPALITLACHAGHTAVPGEALPEELHGFFAEELYQAADPDLQQALRRLALAPYLTAEIVEALLGPSADRVVQRAVELGFLGEGLGKPDLHPLLRTFLGSKFRKRDDDPNGELVGKLTRILVEIEEWDAVFELATCFSDDAILVVLLEASLAHMLDEARLPTLSKWINAAKSQRVQNPIVDLADAELAFRRGELARAEALGCQAARGFAEGHPLTSRSLWLAGTSAHLSVNEEEALKYFQASERVALGESEVRAALWGQFLAAEAFEREEDAQALLEAFAARSGPAVDEQLRIGTGHLLMGSLTGTVDAKIAGNRQLIHLIDRARDPVIACAFLNAFAGTLFVAGRYRETLDAARLQEGLAEQNFLGFVRPFASANIAAAMWGLRQFRACRAGVMQCQRATCSKKLMLLGAQLLARSSLATGRPEEALKILEEAEEIATVAQSLHAEHLAWQSLAHAVFGNDREATRLAAKADALSRRVDVQGLIPWTTAVIASRRRAGARRALSAFALCMKIGNLDAFVAAYRAHPTLLELVAAQRSNHEALRATLGFAEDHALAESVGIHISSPRIAGSRVLTKREREVLDLVSQGLMNKEIARTLFITEATVKVHVRNICQKLGVRSRIEAAMRAAEIDG